MRSYTTVESNSSDIVFDITARLKIPTARVNQNLASRQVDYAVQGICLKRCPNSDLMPLLAIGYWVIHPVLFFITSCTVPREWVADRRRIQQSGQASI